mgnify:CR=1 FL=1
MSQQKRLFLLDAYALIFRGYYAFIKNPRINSKGMDTSAIMGFTNSLLDVIKRERPDHLAVCFDKGGSASRTAMFTEYKANREETPEAIRIAVPYIQQILEDHGLQDAKSVSAPGTSQRKTTDGVTCLTTSEKEISQHCWKADVAYPTSW